MRARYAHAIRTQNVWCWAITLFDDPVDGGQAADPGSLAGALGSKEWLEDLGQSFLVHAAAGVGDGEQYIAAWTDGQMRIDVTFSQVDAGSFDRDHSPLRHGIAGVYDEIHENLFDLSEIGADGTDRAGLKGESDIFADHAQQHLREIAHDGVQVKRTG